MLLSGKWVKLEIIVLSEIKQINKDKAFVLLCMESVGRQERMSKEKKGYWGWERKRERGGGGIKQSARGCE